MKQQRLKRLCRVLAVCMCVLIIGSGYASLVPAIAGTVAGNAGQASYVLTPPPFVGIASAEVPPGTGTAFPADEAGFCSWVNTGQTIDLDKAVQLFSQIEDLGPTHTRGIVPEENWWVTPGIHVYVDTSGYIVAYFDYTDPASKAIKWSKMNFDDPQVAFLTDKAIEDMCTQVGISYGAVENDLRHYDFNYPDAQSMLVFINTKKDGTDDHTTIFVPAGYTLYEAGYSLSDDEGYNSDLYVDGALIAQAYRSVTVGRYDLSAHLEQGVSHTIRTYITSSNYGGSATVLLYTVG